jgi:hypothetical protein
VREIKKLCGAKNKIKTHCRKRVNRTGKQTVSNELGDNAHIKLIILNLAFTINKNPPRFIGADF